MRFYLDTEFTSLETRKPDLISFALAPENGADPLYVVLKSGWKAGSCSAFVLDTVIPLLDLHEPQRLSRKDVAAAVSAYFEGLGVAPAAAFVLADYEPDLQLMQSVLGPEMSSVMRWARLDQESLCEQTADEFWALNSIERHHAMVDATCLKLAHQAFLLAQESQPKKNQKLSQPS